MGIPEGLRGEVWSHPPADTTVPPHGRACSLSSGHISSALGRPQLRLAFSRQPSLTSPAAPDPRPSPHAPRVPTLGALLLFPPDMGACSQCPPPSLQPPQARACLLPGLTQNAARGLDTWAPSKHRGGRQVGTAGASSAQSAMAQPALGSPYSLTPQQTTGSACQRETRALGTPHAV